MRIDELSKILDRTIGDPGWWPARTPFEVAVGAVLTQNTSWGNVEKAIQALAAHDALQPAAILAAPPETLQAWIRPAGYFRQKAARLHTLARWWQNALGDDPHAQPDPARRDEDLRQELLELKGIGPETADSILCYAFARPVFVVDAYTARLAVRLGLIAPPFGYDELQALFTEALPREVELYNRLHAQIVLFAKTRCLKRAPHCDGCPLAYGCGGPAADHAG